MPLTLNSECLLHEYDEVAASLPSTGSTALKIQLPADFQFEAINFYFFVAFKSFFLKALDFKK